MSDFDLSSVVSPMRAAGLDPQDPRALALFKNLAGGGVGMPGADNAAAPSPSSLSTPAAPAPAAPAVPASVSPSGQPSTSDIGRIALSRAMGEMNSLPSAADELSQENSAEARLQADRAKLGQNLRYPVRQGDPNSGKMLPEYRPSVGQRILRGVRGAVVGLGTGGIPGAIRGAVAPDSTWGGTAYGAPNTAGQQELRNERGAVIGDQQSLNEMAARFKERREAATGNAAQLTSIAREENALRDRTKDERKPVYNQKTSSMEYRTPDEIDAAPPGTYLPESAGTKEDTQNKPQAVINTKTGSLEFRTPDEVNKNPKGYRSVSTQNIIVRDNGKEPPQMGVINSQTGNLEFHTKEEVNQDPGKYTLQGVRTKPTNVPKYAQNQGDFESHWKKSLGPGSPLEKKYDAERKSTKADLTAGTITQAQADAYDQETETNREAEKAKLQAEKDTEAEKYQVYNQPHFRRSCAWCNGDTARKERASATEASRHRNPSGIPPK